MAKRSIVVSFMHANENLGIFAKEVCTNRDPVTGRCDPIVVNHVDDIPENVTSHVHVHTPMSHLQLQRITHTGKSVRAGPRRELKNAAYTYGGYRIDMKSQNISGVRLTYTVVPLKRWRKSSHAHLR